MKSEKDWETDSSDDTAARQPGPSKKRKRIVRIGKNKKRNDDTLSWNGNNTRTLIGAIKKDKDLYHDFTTVLDSKITGREVRLEELKTAGNLIGTRSKLPGSDAIEQRIETRSKKIQAKNQYSNVKPFTEAQLPSDDENDVEFDIDRTQSEDHSDHSDDLSDYYGHVETESQMSLRSTESVQISKKTRSKLTITEPIEKLVQKFTFPDVDDIPIEPLNYEQDEIWASFLNDTFIDQVEHTEDDNDSDFNPNEFVDELLESTKDEVQFGIISRKEARDLHYDALEMIYPEPTIRLEDDIRPSVTLPSEEEILNPIEQVVDLVPLEPVGFDINTFTRLITQMHSYVQILGQSIVMARHSSKFTSEYPTRGPLSLADESLFEVYGNTINTDAVELREVGEHAANIRDQAWRCTVNVAPSNAAYQFFSDDMCQMLVSSYLFPFHQLFPQINKIWLDPTKQLKCWGKMSFSPGEENLFLLYYTKFRQSVTDGLIPPNASVIEFMRDNGWMSNRSDQDIKKMVSSMKKRKIDPVVTYLNHGRLIRPHIFESIHDLCYVDFVSFEQQLNTNQINPLHTNVADFLMQFTCKRRKEKKTTSDDKKMKLTERQNIMTVQTTKQLKSNLQNHQHIDNERINKILQIQEKSLKQILLNDAERFLNENLNHATKDDLIDSMPDHCHIFKDNELTQHLQKRLENVPVNQIRNVINLLADNKPDEIRKLLPGSISGDLVSMMELSTVEKPQQNESSNSSSFIANSHSIFAATIPEPSIKPQLTGRQIAETILVPMIEQQIQLPSNERDLFKNIPEYCKSYGKEEKWFREKIETIYDNLICSSTDEESD